MTPASVDIEIAVRLGTAERRVPLVALAAILRVPTATLRDALASFLFADSHSDATSDTVPVAGGRGERFVSIVSVRERNEKFFQKIVSTKGGGAGEENTAPSPVVTAEHLAASLDDWSSIGHLRLLVARHPPALLEDALRRTLAVPRDHIRKTRGAYFTGVVRALAGGDRPRLNS